MASEKQIRANRENAKHSTGPRTESGKSISCLNAVKRGVLARHVVLRGEDAEAFEALEEGLRATLKPHGALEGLLFEIVVKEAWRLQPCLRVETALFNKAIYSEVAANARAEIALAVDQSSLWQRAVKMAHEEESEAIAKAPDAHRRLREAESILGAQIAQTLMTDTDETLLTKLPRYEAHFQRGFSRALAEFRPAAPHRGRQARHPHRQPRLSR